MGASADEGAWPIGERHRLRFRLPTVIRVDAVGDEYPFARASGSAQHLVQEPAGSADEWTSYTIFVCAGCLTDEHHVRREPRPLNACSNDTYRLLP